MQEVVIICIDNKKFKPKKVVGDNVSIIHKKAALHDIASFTGIYEKNLIGKTKIKLYKSVHPETYCDFRTGRIKYDGLVICPDWKPNPEIECGNGLHLSPRPKLALEYNKGTILECEVTLSDIAVYAHNISKVRCAKVKVLRELKPKEIF